MKQTITIDRAGRIVIPNPMRDTLRLAPGDSLEVETCGDQITLRPVRAPGQLVNEQGIWVYTGAIGDIAITALIEQVRDEGREDLLG